MKRRIVAVILAMCLCISSQSVVYAGQENTSQQEVHTEGSAEGSENGDEVDSTPQKNPGQTEEAGTGESTKEPESGEEAGTGETTQQPEGSEETGTEEGTEEPEGSEETGTEESTEEPEGSEDSGTEESTEEPESSEEAGKGETTGQPGENDTEETTAQPEETDAEETTEQPGKTDMEVIAEQLEETEISDESDTVRKGRSVAKPDIPDVDIDTLTPAKVYDAMIALKGWEDYKEGREWTNDVPYSDANLYRWHGGTLGGVNISAVGCVAFAFTLSDASFGELKARMYDPGAFTFEDIKVGDILRVRGDAHTVIVLEVSDAGVVVAEGNYNGTVHWERKISKDEVMKDTSHYITRYPEGYIVPDDPEANKIAGQGPLEGGLSWKLTNAGTLTISGNGAMPDYSSVGDQPWSGKKIRKVVIQNGVTSIGSCAFWKCELLSVEIPSSVQNIGNSAFRESDIISVKIPSSVKTISDSAFQQCQSLGTVTISNGLESIGQNAFRACTSLASISLPASVGEVGAGAFFDCSEMTSATFAPGSKQVSMGDNMFSRCYKLMSVKLPSSVDRIADGMFQNCGILARVEIPKGAESIGRSAFASCSAMSAIVIPDSVTTIAIGAFSACPLKNIYFTGDEAQWKRINLQGDSTVSVVSNATIHYNYVPTTDPDPGEEDDNDNNTGDGSENKPGGPSDENKPGGPSDENKPGGPSDENKPGGPSNENKPGDSSDESKPGEDKPGENKPNDSSSDDNSSDVKAAVETWKPTTPDEIKRYACVGKEVVQYTLPEENVYQVDVENAMQGPMCFQAFEAVLEDYTIGRTYNIYAISDTTYSTDQKVQITIKIPSAIYKKDREYKMICVTKGGLPIVYEDLDSDPKTITIETDKFHAYALVYK